MNDLSISPPARPFPGACEAPADGPSFRRRVRDGWSAAKLRFGASRLLAAAVVTSALLAGAAFQLSGGLYIVLKARLAQHLIANAWNDNLASPQTIERPWPWADMRPIARMELPNQQEPLYVLDNDSGRTLAFGPGLRAGSAKPGTGGNTVISGHRDTHFAILRDIRHGDQIRLQTVDKRLLTYQVSHLQIVDQSDTWVAADHGLDELTLVTCWPFDALTPRGPERLIISARRIQ